MNSLFYQNSILPIYNEDIAYLQDSVESSLKENFSQTITNSGLPSVINGFTIQANSSDSSKFDVVSMYNNASGGLCDASGKIYATSESFTSQSFTTNITDTMAATPNTSNTYIVYAVIGKKYGSYDRTNKKVILDSKLAIDRSTYAKVYDRAVDTISIVSMLTDKGTDGIVTPPVLEGFTLIELGRCIFSSKTTFTISYLRVNYAKSRITENTITEAMMSPSIAIPQKYVANSDSDTGHISLRTSISADNVYYTPTTLLQDIDNIRSNIRAMKGTLTWDDDSHGVLSNLDPSINALHQNGVLPDAIGTLDLSVAESNRVVLSEGKYLKDGVVAVNLTPKSLSFKALELNKTSEHEDSWSNYSRVKPRPFKVDNTYLIGNVIIHPVNIDGDADETITYVEDSGLTLVNDFRINNDRAYLILDAYTDISEALGHNLIGSQTLTILIDNAAAVTLTIDNIGSTWGDLIAAFKIAATAANLEVACSIETTSKRLKITNISIAGGATIALDTALSTLYTNMGSTLGIRHFYFNKGYLTPLSTSIAAAESILIKYNYSFARYDAITCNKNSGNFSFAIIDGSNVDALLKPTYENVAAAYDTLYLVYRNPFRNVTADDIVDCRSYVEPAIENRTFLVSSSSIITDAVTANKHLRFIRNKFIGLDNSNNYIPIDSLVNHWKSAAGSNGAYVSTPTVGDKVEITSYCRKDDGLWAYFDMGPSYSLTSSVTVTVSKPNDSSYIAITKTISLYATAAMIKVHQFIIDGLPEGNVTISFAINEAVTGNLVKLYGVTIGRLEQSLGVSGNRFAVTSIDTLNATSLTAKSLVVLNDTTIKNSINGLIVANNGLLGSSTILPVAVTKADGLTSIGTSGGSISIYGSLLLPQNASRLLATDDTGKIISAAGGTYGINISGNATTASTCSGRAATAGYADTAGYCSGTTETTNTLKVAGGPCIRAKRIDAYIPCSITNKYETTSTTNNYVTTVIEIRYSGSSTSVDRGYLAACIVTFSVSNGVGTAMNAWITMDNGHYIVNAIASSTSSVVHIIFDVLYED